MNKENISEIYSFISDIGDDGSLDIPKEKLLELKNKGFVQVTLLVLGESKLAAEKQGIDQNLYENIKKTQKIPGEIALDFLNTKGEIKDLKNRLKSFDNK